MKKIKNKVFIDKLLFKKKREREKGGKARKDHFCNKEQRSKERGKDEEKGEERGYSCQYLRNKRKYLPKCEKVNARESTPIFVLSAFRKYSLFVAESCAQFYILQFLFLL